MNLYIEKSQIHGEVNIPGSKSHTIRALFLALMARGESIIKYPLISRDTLSAVKAARSLGANIKIEKNCFIVKGTGGDIKVPENVIDVGNSGTTLRFLLTIVSLIKGTSILTGDEQIIKRPLDELIKSLNQLGAKIVSTKGNGCAPVIVKGPLNKTNTSIRAITSQFLSSLLIGLPFYKKDVNITIELLNEKPYVDITLWWLDTMGLKYKNYDYKKFKVYGNQSIEGFSIKIPGDFSSASFFVIAACITGGEVILKNLDISDSQGDKRVLDIVKNMGAEVIYDKNNIIIKGNSLKGIDIDMNDIPDALPIMAVCGCYAKGVTRLLNVPQARLKETDRIKAMYEELKKMGAEIEELEDGLVIHESVLHSACLNGRGDHRIIMALSVAALNLSGETIIEEAEAIDVTFPNFPDLMKKIGAIMEYGEEE